MKTIPGRMLLVFALVAVVGAAAADAQTTRRRKTTKKTAQTTARRPVAPAQVPTVVSRSDDYTTTSQQIITGVVPQPEQQVPTQTVETALPETLDQKIDRLNSRLKEMNSRMKAMESSKASEAEEIRKRLIANIDILSRAEQRAEMLRKQSYDLVDKENSIKMQLTGLEYDMRPDVIERQVSMAGSLRPEELREQRRKALEMQRGNLQSLLTDIQSRRADVDESARKADELVVKLRLVLEKDIDDALNSSSGQ